MIFYRKGTEKIELVARPGLYELFRCALELQFGDSGLPSNLLRMSIFLVLSSALMKFKCNWSILSQRSATVFWSVWDCCCMAG